MSDYTPVLFTIAEGACVKAGEKIRELSFQLERGQPYVAMETALIRMKAEIEIAMVYINNAKDSRNRP